MSTTINEELGTEVYVPTTFHDLEIHTSFISYSTGKPSMVDVYYGLEKDDRNVYFENKDEIKDWEETMHTNLLYGPYGDEELFMLSFRKGNFPTDDDLRNWEEIELEGAPVLTYFNEAARYYHVRIDVADGHYLLRFLPSHYADEEALEKTQTFIEFLNNS
ncbi:hypothetical protein LGQ02_10570 [Bacillus shivajii]|uniref:hypothetical protein n=1 Tax=Bacillus shivajii TaxID=1983719 RepID=UPI001CF9E6BE|nr:hypothetical protein [Bacillus shivajii]UCZ55129.1 hypothetical protein LGQ02_10570 [Bacillus shivajii]